jgi:protein-disulfide isomerase
MVITRTILSNACTGILVLCAIVVTSLCVSQYFRAREDQTHGPTELTQWRRLVENRPANLGSDSASLKIIEFSDYQCPYCKQLEPNLQRLVDRNAGRVAVVRYNLPLRAVHPRAFAAALAAQCAASQGVYESYEAALFEADLATVDWMDIARKTKVPSIATFASCLEDKKTAAQIADDVGIKDTPTLVIEGKVFAGMQTESALERLVAAGR